LIAWSLMRLPVLPSVHTLFLCGKTNLSLLILWVWSKRSMSLLRGRSWLRHRSKLKRRYHQTWHLYRLFDA
jgi:hypothetical protein